MLKIWTSHCYSPDIQEYYEVILLDENKAAEEKAEETLEMVDKLEEQQAHEPPMEESAPQVLISNCSW